MNFEDIVGFVQRGMAAQRAVDAYIDETYPERNCDYCQRPYRGPAVYCSLRCAQDDAMPQQALVHMLTEKGLLCGHPAAGTISVTLAHVNDPLLLEVNCAECLAKFEAHRRAG
jgi:hypothetical protein